MNRSIFRFTLNMHSHRSQASVAAFRGDTGIRLCITLTDGGNPYVIEKGCSAILSGTKADGNKLWNRCVIDHITNTIIYDFTEQTATRKGVVNCEITLYGPDGHVITAPKFIIVVDEREVNFDEIPESAIELDALELILHSEEEREAQEAERQRQEALREDAEAQRGVALGEHNVDEKAHADIRERIEAASDEAEKASGEALAAHNEDEEAHADIRKRIDILADSGLDVEIVDNLVTDSDTKPLSARQGMFLEQSINNHESLISDNRIRIEALDEQGGVLTQEIARLDSQVFGNTFRVVAIEEQLFGVDEILASVAEGGAF